jgi:hypothetical protein
MSVPPSRSQPPARPASRAARARRQPQQAGQPRQLAARDLPLVERLQVAGAAQRGPRVGERIGRAVAGLQAQIRRRVEAADGRPQRSLPQRRPHRREGRLRRVELLGELEHVARAGGDVHEGPLVQQPDRDLARRLGEQRRAVRAHSEATRRVNSSPCAAPVKRTPAPCAPPAPPARASRCPARAPRCNVPSFSSRGTSGKSSRASTSRPPRAVLHRAAQEARELGRAAPASRRGRIGRPFPGLLAGSDHAAPSAAGEPCRARIAARHAARAGASSHHSPPCWCSCLPISQSATPLASATSP